MWKRTILKDADAEKVAQTMQPLLCSLIDLGLIAKQAHWSVFGRHFLAVHEKLDEVVESARNFGDLVAERMSKLGICPDGRVQTVASMSEVQAYPHGFHDDSETISLVCTRLHIVCALLRKARAAVEELDPYTEDLIIEIGRELEEHLWMLQAMEGHSPS